MEILAAQTVPFWQTVVAVTTVVGILASLVAVNAWARNRRGRGEEATSLDSDVPNRGL